MASLFFFTYLTLRWNVWPWPNHSAFYIVTGWSTWTSGHGSSSFEPRCSSVTSAAAGLWYQQWSGSENFMDDWCRRSHKSRGFDDCNACETNLWASVSDIESPTEPALNYWIWAFQHPPSNACYQLNAYDMQMIFVFVIEIRIVLIGISRLL